jgi:hypothetical protein
MIISMLEKLADGGIAQYDVIGKATHLTRLERQSHIVLHWFKDLFTLPTAVIADTAQTLVEGEFLKQYHSIMGVAPPSPDIMFDGLSLRTHLSGWTLMLKNHSTIRWWVLALQHHEAWRATDKTQPMNDPIITMHDIVQRLGFDPIIEIPLQHRSYVLGNVGMLKTAKELRWPHHKPGTNESFALYISWLYIRDMFDEYEVAWDDVVKNGLQAPVEVILPSWRLPPKIEGKVEYSGERKQAADLPDDADKTMVWFKVMVGATQNPYADAYWTDLQNSIRSTAQAAASKQTQAALLGAFQDHIPTSVFKYGHYEHKVYNDISPTVYQFTSPEYHKFNALLMKCAMIMVPCFRTYHFVTKFEIQDAIFRFCQCMAYTIRVVGIAMDMRDDTNAFGDFLNAVLDGDAPQMKLKDEEGEEDEEGEGEVEEGSEEYKRLIVSYTVNVIKYFKPFYGTLTCIQSGALEEVAKLVRIFLDKNQQEAAKQFGLRFSFIQEDDHKIHTLRPQDLKSQAYRYGVFGVHVVWAYVSVILHFNTELGVDVVLSCVQGDHRQDRQRDAVAVLRAPH